ncbi:AI-2E family transporter [Corynebacterium sp. H127]|uniref:AI-2E family transporter n=1 Tax=Corynebacterium sp. H127 TaxID=3133418 RepID=UPI00403EFEA9
MSESEPTQVSGFSSVGDAPWTFEELERGPHVDRSIIIAEGLKEFASWCLRLLIIAAATYMVWFVGKQVWQGILPVVFAIIVSSVLWTPTKWLRDRGLPAGLAALISIVSTLGIFGAVIAAMAPSIGRQSQTLYLQTYEMLLQAQLTLQEPPFNLDSEDLNDLFSNSISWLQNQSGQIATEVFSGLGTMSIVVVTLGVVLVLTFFFLKDGDRFLPWLRGITGERAGLHLTELLSRMWKTLSGFIRAQAVVSLVDAICIGTGLVLIGVPMALALATLTFFAGFIPIVGAFVAGALAVLIALVSLGVTKALLVLILVVAVQQLEGNILSPMLQSKAMNLHPVIVLLSVTLGGSLFGIIGAFLAVPVAAMIAVFFRYLNDIIALKVGEKTTEEIQFATQDSEMQIKWVAEFGKLFRDGGLQKLLPQRQPAAAATIAAEEDDAKDLVGSMLNRAGKTTKKLAQTFPKIRRK